MNRFKRGATRTHLLLALIFTLALLVGYHYFKAQYGITGNVAGIPKSTAEHIAFIRQEKGQTNVFIIKSDGSEMSQITDDRSSKRAPAWSPDGKQLCYSGEPEIGESEGRAFQIFIVGSGKPTQITRGSQSKDSPQWRPGTNQIGFLAGGAIKVVSSNGSDALQIYPPPHKGKGDIESDDETTVAPAGADPAKRPPINAYRWSPNGKSLVALQVTEGDVAATLGDPRWWQKKNDRGAAGDPDRGIVMEPESLIMLPSIEAEKPSLLPISNSQKVSFAWFPDANLLVAAISTRRNEHVIVRYRADDPRGNPSAIFASTGAELAPDNPDVSPDGKTILFEVWRAPKPESRELIGLAAIPADPTVPLTINKPGQGARVPVIVRGDAHNPRCSPDGKKILFWRYGTSGRDIWVCNADGSNQVNLTKGVGDNSDAVWSPAR